MKSIRKKLLISMLSVVTTVTVLLAIVTYFSVRHEMDELYDENMRQVATTLSQTDIENQKIPAVEKAGKLHGEEEFLIQVWRKDTLYHTSHPAIAFDLQPQDGFGNSPFQENTWRYFRLQSGENIIQLAQDLHSRHGVIREIYGVLLIPILVQLPVMVLLIWILIGYGLKPLADISNLIRKRSPSFLDPIPGNNIPVEIGAIVDALNGLLERLKIALDTQRRFTADAAHELRTPLAAIRLQLDLLNRAVGVEDREAALESLAQGIERSIRLVHQLLELARQEPGAVAAGHSQIDLSQILSDVVTRIRPDADMKSITLTADIQRPLTAGGNAHQLDVMLQNLVYNAVLYTPDHGHVRILAHKDGTGIRIDIIDDGIGIALKDRARVFDRFFRVAGTGRNGSGLGLSIVQNIALAHGIEISIADGLGGSGTTFRISLPETP